MSSAPCEGLQGECPFSEIERQRIYAHLEELLTSPPFAGSRRRQAFLRYVVEEALAGRGSTIKETNIAIDVFGRGRDFDAQGASVVRVTGGEVRKRLVQAYSSGLGQDIRIELPLGSYQPSFHFSNALAVDVTATPGPSGILPAVRRRAARNPWILIPAGVVLVALASFYLLGMFRAPSAMDQFWRPFLSKDRPTLISIASPPLYKMNPFGQNPWGPLDAKKMIPATDLVLLVNSYVGTGGAMGAARFAEQLTTRSQKFDLKFGTDATFADLKNSPTILVGVSNLTQRLTTTTRFQLKMVGPGIMIVDTKQKNRVWELPRRSFGSPPRSDGYSLITRLLRSDSGYPVLIIVGMDSLNTQAAVEFLTHNDLFRRFSDSAPSDWSGKNFQVVLHNSIYGNSPGPLQIVASDVW